VILQFCSNDPADNFKNRVTKIGNGRFIFQNSQNSLNWVKKYLSKSIIQKSQTYNLVKGVIYTFFHKRIIMKEVKSASKGNSMGDKKIAPEYSYYNDLLELFVKDLNRQNVKMIMISVNGQLNNSEYIKEKVSSLNAAGLLDYYEVVPWFEGVANIGSPEGHAWGRKAHHIIGVNLSELILNHLGFN